MRAPIASLVLILFSLTAACSSKSSGKGTDGTTACADTADAFAKAEQRCGYDYQTAYNGFVNSLGGCDKVVSVRDETTLRSICIPSFSTIACTDLANANLDASCKSQLITAANETIVPAGVFGVMAGKLEE